MGPPDDTPFALRITRGSADDDELAALAVVLCAVLAGRGEGGDEEPEAEDVPWRPAGGQACGHYHSPYHWR